jgi:2-hydroxychromene-2-carboxylate isomerase
MIDFFFDLSSPYSYLASTQIEKIAAAGGATVRWRPMVLAAVFAATDNRMPAHSQPKARWMIGDLQRWAAQYGVPFTMTSRFPVNAMKAHRMILAAGDRGAELARALFDALWNEDRDLNDDGQLEAIARGAGLDGAALIARTQEQAVKDALRANTDEAIRRGAFGAPAIFVGDQLFWGNDRLHFVEAALKERL